MQLHRKLRRMEQMLQQLDQSGSAALVAAAPALAPTAATSLGLQQSATRPMTGVAASEATAAVRSTKRDQPHAVAPVAGQVQAAGASSAALPMQHPAVSAATSLRSGLLDTSVSQSGAGAASLAPVAVGALAVQLTAEEDHLQRIDRLKWEIEEKKRQVRHCMRASRTCQEAAGDCRHSERLSRTLSVQCSDCCLMHVALRMPGMCLCSTRPGCTSCCCPAGPPAAATEGGGAAQG